MTEQTLTIYFELFEQDFNKMIHTANKSRQNSTTIEFYFGKLKPALHKRAGFLFCGHFQHESEC